MLLPDIVRGEAYLHVHVHMQNLGTKTGQNFLDLHKILTSKFFPKIFVQKIYLTKIKQIAGNLFPVT